MSLNIWRPPHPDLPHSPEQQANFESLEEYLQGLLQGKVITMGNAVLEWPGGTHFSSGLVLKGLPSAVKYLLATAGPGAILAFSYQILSATTIEVAAWSAAEPAAKAKFPFTYLVASE